MRGNARAKDLQAIRAQIYRSERATLKAVAELKLIGDGVSEAQPKVPTAYCLNNLCVECSFDLFR